MYFLHRLVEMVKYDTDVKNMHDLREVTVYVFHVIVVVVVIQKRYVSPPKMDGEK